ncbi:BirA family transcriptional regulator, biotin operon repressor / biotin-[acetyl-CoA-carboxylase] ligase [Haloechinothrix alba]|uniref:biotin--[biotin carboxyl-carrier protein] ligase n=1 Tax=Haloechinothrix alba TaxID=664784 RepID=A0A238VWE6_9PSEU|nr:biotin--[acetyl-CoA-carboxylase] ligase [Haloechinothrix alba]SNR38511.1 BirA family transcriptional regulator, biotin operon repressor / biotin-[acetyl-CoA-carboxylase] ligase [Haloechinothrix alba]
MTAPDTALDGERLRTHLAAPNGPYAAVEVVDSTGSTNADLRDAAARGAADLTVRIAGEQTAGAGRHSRTWTSPAGCGVYLSVLLRPAGVPVRNLSSIALVAGLAVLDVAREAGVSAHLKWPNDVLVGDAEAEAKCAGILSEMVPEADPAHPATVLGIGVNVHPVPDVTPGPGALPATSLDEHGARVTDRTEVAITLLRALADRERRWRVSSGDIDDAGMHSEYRMHCRTLGEPVEVTLPDGAVLTGRAGDVDPIGQLLVDSADGTRHTVVAGDVVHVRRRT